MVRFVNSLLYCALTIPFALMVPCAFAQQAPKGQPSVPTNPSSGENIISFFSSRTPYEFWLTVTIGIIGLLVIILIIYAVRRVERPRPEDITRPIIVVTVIMGTLILITAGYSNEQVAPAFGLFGTIIGYILGRLSQTVPAANAAQQVEQARTTS